MPITATTRSTVVGAPERPDNWRLGAKPAQAAFTTVAETIAGTEAVTVLASTGQYVNARERLSDRVRVVEMTTDDAWVREGIKEIAQMDGAIVVSADGTVEAACRYLDCSAASDADSHPSLTMPSIT